MVSAKESFSQLVQRAVENEELIKITLGNKRAKDTDLKNVFIRPVLLKAGNKLSFVYRHSTKDITKNFDLPEAIVMLQTLLTTEFYNADLFTLSNDHHLLLSKSGTGKMVTSPASLANKGGQQQHDRQKQRMIATQENIYLRELGITTAEGLVKKDMQDKFKQINHYIEIIDGIIKDLSFGKEVHVTDMGSGKGYLTFALYDYLSASQQLQAYITGIELRQDLVDTCNQVTRTVGFDHLHFEKGSIADAELTGMDILIALHACDTATDDAIYRGIQANAKVIICAPCCHKQIRKQMKPTNALSSITRHGILLERQAEIVTDNIRALLLEASGYRTRVFEFISTEHTPKNVMITAIRSDRPGHDPGEYLEKVKALKELFNIESHYLEKLLEQ